MAIKTLPPPVLTEEEQELARRPVESLTKEEVGRRWEIAMRYLPYVHALILERTGGEGISEVELHEVLDTMRDRE